MSGHGICVAVGISGGVDSSVAAFLLKEKGYYVTGVTLVTDLVTSEFIAKEDLYSLPSVKRAREACAVLGIPHDIVDVRTDFRKNVIDYFAGTYRNGKTPNPCVVCNRTIKWTGLIRSAERTGAGYVATGHYAGVVRTEQGRYAVRRSASPKDQSYALYALTQEQLTRTLFPLGDLPKDEVRDIAKIHGLPAAQIKDSQDICFIPDGDHTAFISSYTGAEDEPGYFVDSHRNILGEHKGITHYTVGQRKGLGLALPEPYYVRKIVAERNEVVLGRAEELMQESLLAGELCFMGADQLDEPVRVEAKIRYNHRPVPAVIAMNDENTVICRFEEPVRAVTPGQAAVFYKDGVILMGGTIL